MFRKLICLLLFMPSMVCADEYELEHGYASRVRDEKLVAERAERFQREMRRQGFAGGFGSCSHMMLVAVGTAHGNMSYGAVCRIDVGGKSQAVLVCDDDDLGRFVVKSSASRYGIIAADEVVTEFTRQNCYGG